MGELNTLRYPVIRTRDAVVFFFFLVAIEVGREMSLNAIRRSNESFEGEIFLVSQIDPLVDYPNVNDLYEVGTICRIVTIHKKDSYSKVVSRVSSVIGLSSRRSHPVSVAMTASSANSIFFIV